MNQFNLLFEATYSNLRFRLALHVIFWVLMGVSFYYFNTISFTPASGTSAAYWLAVKNVVEYAAAFYILMYVIWPRFIYKRRWLLAAGALLLWILGVAALDAWADRLIVLQVKPYALRMQEFYVEYYRFLQRSFVNIVLARALTGGLLYHLLMQLSFPIALKIGRSHFRQTVQGLQLAKENLQLEFNFLKAQVNPHFLFNTLNNIYALVTAGRNPDAAATLSRLSGFMRYTLYETGAETIELKKEIQLLKDYTELEKLRLNKTTVTFVSHSDHEDYSVPPLLFMPALENAFKYATDVEGSRIEVDIKALSGRLEVLIKNNFLPDQSTTRGGIGLTNLQRRLVHYFGNKAEYSATASNDVYLFRLSCPLI